MCPVYEAGLSPPRRAVSREPDARAGQLGSIFAPAGELGLRVPVPQQEGSIPACARESIIGSW